jgi:uncharacterized protein (UPF0262 family)
MSENEAGAVGSENRLIDISLDERTVVRRSPEVEHERQVAIFDLLEGNHFAPNGDHTGPFSLHLSIEENRLLFDICDGQKESLPAVTLPLLPFRRIVRDYFEVCESYFEAIKTASPARIESIDMGRRGLHDDGSELLRERLDGKIDIDFDTARRLFTLICVIHIRS